MGGQARRAHSGPRLPHMPALDGLRGLALVAILLAHGGVEQVRGGHLALTAFFTLSGFLITGLLLVERHRTGTVDLRQFWTRRARRLVPALLLCFPLVAAVVLLADRAPGSGLLLDAVAAATWVANWRFIASDQTYADLFALPSPFQHFWSLAVEEQFYLVFPLVLLVVLGRSTTPRTRRLAVLLGVLVLVSTLQLARLHAADGALGRAYYGTDARLAEILVGSLLALALVGPQGLRPVAPRVQVVLDAVGAAGLVALVALFVVLGEADPLTYRGGFLLAALCTAGVVAAGTQPRSVVTRVLSLRPLVWLGLVSYGVYLFHWPLFLLLTATSTGLGTGALLAVRLATVVALAAASYLLLEQPVRTGSLPALPALGGWATGAVAGVVVVAAASTAVTLVPRPAQEVLRTSGSVRAAEPVREQQTTAAPAPVAPAAPAAPTSAAPAPVQATAPTSTRTATAAAPARRPEGAAAPRGAPAAAAVPAASLEDPEDVPVPTPPPTAPSTLKVAVVGDSIAGNLATGLSRWAAADGVDVEVVSFALGGCPVSRGRERQIDQHHQLAISPECPWWADPSGERWEAFAALDPHVVLVEAGIAESFDRKPTGSDDYRTPGDPTFDAWLLSEYRTATERLASLGAEVLLGNAPCADWDRYEVLRDMDPHGNTRVRSVNRVLQRVGPQLVDLHGRICPGGEFVADVEGVADARADGFHFVETSVEALARNWLGGLVLAARPPA